MSSLALNLENFLNNGKNLYKIFFFLVVFLCAAELPTVFNTDMQPWDEGMYATRVLSIHNNSDFIDQSQHSVGGFYSGSHPPLLIWTGYIFTLIFGLNPYVFKLIIFILSLMCILMMLMTGRSAFSLSTGFFASIIFSANIVFTVFSQRFQFDIPYTFLMLLSVYFIFRFNDTMQRKYLYMSAVSFGLCLMVKILVGFYIPMIFFLSFFFIKDKVSFRFRDLVILTTIGILIALPWHAFMLVKYGSGFTDYFFKFHIIDRALQGVEFNEKNSGPLYHVNYLLSIIPFSVLVFFCCINYFRNFRELQWQKTFFLVWFITGLLIISGFRTKLEVYVLMILVPGSFMIADYLRTIDKEKNLTKVFIILFTFLNFLWFATESVRPAIKLYLVEHDKLLIIAAGIAGIVILYFLSRWLADKIELKKVFYIFILVFFISTNVYYLLNTPQWVNKFQLSEIKQMISDSGRKNIFYIGTNYHHNPQFSFYFNGLDINWENREYEFTLTDTQNGFDKVRHNVEALDKGKYFVIVEKDYINRAVYPDSKLFLPDDLKLKKKTRGYEVYEN